MSYTHFQLLRDFAVTYSMERRSPIPRPIEWFQRLPHILAQLDSPKQPNWLDRAAVEHLFGVSRRNAHYLMARFGAQRLGNLLVIEPAALAAKLRELITQDQVVRQVRRHERVRAFIQERRAGLKLARITLPEPTIGALAHLPESIRLAPGHLAIDFTGAIDLLTQLTELSKAIGDDFDRFEGLLNQDPLLD